MACYCAYMDFTNEEAMDSFMDWVDANKRSFLIIRAKAWPEPPRLSNEEFVTSGRWMARIFLQTEEDARRLYRQWRPDYCEDWEIEPWR